MPKGSLRRIRKAVLPSNAPGDTPLFVVQTGLLREKYHILGTLGPIQLRDVILWNNEEDALEWGIVVARRQLDDLDTEERHEIIGSLVRPVADEDFDKITQLRRDELEATDKCRERVALRNLPMKILGTDWRYDRSKVTFHFSAEQRVDFRILVRDLAAIFRCRIELHQIGVRDETALYGGMGTCGRELCCHQHLDSFPSVAVKMAKRQNLMMGTDLTSGVCGRLKCCLRYEYDMYEELAAELPGLGERREIDGLPGEITQLLPLSGLVIVRYDDGHRDTLTAAEWEAGTRNKSTASAVMPGESGSLRKPSMTMLVPGE